jgi:hypothetical protein
MSQLLKDAINKAAQEAIQHYLGASYEGSSNSVLSPDKFTHRRSSNMKWFDFSDEELRIVNEIEKKPGMKQSEIIAFMSVAGSGPEDVSCEAGTTKFLLANLVKRRVLVSSPSNGYRINE